MRSLSGKLTRSLKCNDSTQVINGGVDIKGRHKEFHSRVIPIDKKDMCITGIVWCFGE